MAIVDVERQPGMEKLARAAVGGGGGGLLGGTQMWRVCRRGHPDQATATVSMERQE